MGWIVVDHENIRVKLNTINIAQIQTDVLAKVFTVYFVNGHNIQLGEEAIAAIEEEMHESMTYKPLGTVPPDDQPPPSILPSS